MSASDQTLTTRCLLCNAELVWTWLFCRTAPPDFNYFNCGRHTPARPTPPTDTPAPPTDPGHT